MGLSFINFKQKARPYRRDAQKETGDTQSFKNEFFESALSARGHKAANYFVSAFLCALIPEVISNTLRIFGLTPGISEVQLYYFERKAQVLTGVKQVVYYIIPHLAGQQRAHVFTLFYAVADKG
jgi:hypothetical protein